MLQKIRVREIVALILALGLIGCNSDRETTLSARDTSTTQDRPVVVATTSVLCDLTTQVAAETVDLKCLVGAGVDPHTYQPKPEDRKAIETANLILYGGYNFEPSIIKLVKATSNNAPKIAVHEVAVPQPLMGAEHGHEGEEHSDETPDPHVWQDAQNGVRMVETIQTNLEKVFPRNVQLYTSNAEKVTGEIKQLDNWIQQNIATIPGNQRKLVTTHDALNYYTQAYNIDYKGALEGLSTQAEPTAAKIAQLSKEIKQENVPTIFAENTSNPKLIEKVAREANVKVSDKKLYADGIGEQGTDADTYQKMLVANTKAIVEGLGGKYTVPQE